MLRQRLRARTSTLAGSMQRLLATLLGLALVWYGVMAILLAIKVSPHTVNEISAYHTIYHRLSTITAHGITGLDRGITAAAGVVCFLVCAPLAWRALPRPYLARSAVALTGQDDRGATTVAARAIERAAEIAALAHPHVCGAAGRFGTDDVAVAVELSEAMTVPETLRAVQASVVGALSRHGLPEVPVNVTMTSFERTNRRELQ